MESSMESSIFSPPSHVTHAGDKVSSSSLARQAVFTLLAGLPGAVSLGLWLVYPVLWPIQVAVAGTQPWFPALSLLGGALGSLLAAFKLDRWGRKFTLMNAALPSAVGWFLVQTTALIPTEGGRWAGLVAVYVSRMGVGMGAGMLLCSLPVYVAETADSHVRGALSFCVLQLGMAGGVSLGAALGLLLGVEWQWVAVAGSAVAALGVLTALLVPETPRWYLRQGRQAEALASLRTLHGPHAHTEAECLHIKQALEEEVDCGLAVSELCSSGALKPLAISMGLMLFQQASGIHVITYYAKSIMEEYYSDSTYLLPLLLGVAVVTVLTMVPGLLLIDRLGRRPLLVMSGALMGLSQAGGLGMYYYFNNNQLDEGLKWLPIVCLIVFVCGFSLGWGPIPWIVHGEVVPIVYRTTVGSVAPMFSWIIAFAFTVYLITADMTVVSKYIVFWVLGGVCILGVLFVLVFVRETRRKALEDIHLYFKRGRTGTYRSLAQSSEEQQGLI